MRLTKPKKVYRQKTADHSGKNGGYRLSKDIDMGITKLMQIRRNYQSISRFGTSHTSSFVSLVKLADGWYINHPYYIYSGEVPHTYKRLPRNMQFKINCIDVCGKYYDFINKIISKITYKPFKGYHEIKRQAKKVVGYYTKDARECRATVEAFKKLFNVEK